MRELPQLSYDEIINMNIHDFNKVCEGLYRLKTRDTLSMLDAASFPHMDKDARKKMHKELHRRAFPKNFEQKALRAEDLILV